VKHKVQQKNQFTANKSLQTNHRIAGSKSRIIHRKAQVNLKNGSAVNCLFYSCSLLIAMNSLWQTCSAVIYFTFQNFIRWTGCGELFAIHLLFTVNQIFRFPLPKHSGRQVYGSFEFKKFTQNFGFSIPKLRDFWPKTSGFLNQVSVFSNQNFVFLKTSVSCF
jgi:hypothetical protein